MSYRDLLVIGHDGNITNNRTFYQGQRKRLPHVVKARLVDFDLKFEVECPYEEGSCRDSRGCVVVNTVIMEGFPGVASGFDGDLSFPLEVDWTLRNGELWITPWDAS